MIKRCIATVSVFSALFVFSGCFLTGSGSKGHVSQDRVQVYENPSALPRSLLKEQGEKYVYMYYPSNNIYYDSGRGLYFYTRNGAWKTSKSIPAGLSSGIGSYVTIGMDTDRPYTHHDEVQKKLSIGRK